jgi:hypothetical protein
VTTRKVEGERETKIQKKFWPERSNFKKYFSKFLEDHPTIQPGLAGRWSMVREVVPVERWRCLS